MVDNYIYHLGENCQFSDLEQHCHTTPHFDIWVLESGIAYQRSVTDAEDINVFKTNVMYGSARCE